MKKRLVIPLLIIPLLFGSIINASSVKLTIEPIAELTLLYWGGVKSDCCLYIIEQLREIGIEVEVRTPLLQYGYIPDLNEIDMHLLALSGIRRDPDLSHIYSKTGPLNVFGLDTSIPYGQENKDMLEEGIRITNITDRQQHYYDWQKLIMDKIVPLKPFFSPRSYVASWSTLIGYKYQWSLTDNLPYMEFTDYHEGQSDTTELIIADSNWEGLNPLLYDNYVSQEIISLISEPLLKIAPDSEYLKTGIIYDWEQDDWSNKYETHFQFFMRDNIYWNPSYNITGRDNTSLPLVLAPLMPGLKSGEISNGTNHQVTAKDAVFTLLTHANPITNKNADYYAWINDIWIDPTNPLSFHIIVDGNPSTVELDPYAPFLYDLNLAILPEFFLNSSMTNSTYSSGGKEMKGIYEGIESTSQWQTYAISAFFSGKYMLDYSIKNSITVLRASPYWFGIGAKDGQPQDLDLETIKIRIIPDLTSALVEFKEGNLDLTSLSLFSEMRKEMQDDPLFTVQNKIANYMSFLAFNLHRPFVGGDDNYVYLNETGKEGYTKACAVRKAICYAINLEDMNNDIYNGEYLTSFSPIHPIHSFWYYQDIIKYKHNLESAYEWLEAAGYETPVTETSNNKTTITSVVFYVIPISLFYLIKIQRRRKT